MFWFSVYEVKKNKYIPLVHIVEIFCWFLFVQSSLDIFVEMQEQYQHGFYVLLPTLKPCKEIK